MNDIDSQFIALVGPESTGKTTLARDLAAHFSGVFLPEYARAYLHGVNYTEEDVHIVAHEQLAREVDFVRASPLVGIFDTDGVVLRVWFSERYKYVPAYIKRHIETQTSRKYLLTYPDLQWEFDPRRESQFDRIRLFDVYERTLSAQGMAYEIVRGQGEERIANALKAVAWLLEG